MKPKSIDKNDPKMVTHDLLFGIQEQKDNGRVKLVMSLVNLATDIQYVESKKLKRNLLNSFNLVCSELSLTDKEKRLFYFEMREIGS
jgi:hypothetical protein